MQIHNTTQNFKGLDFDYVSAADRELFIKGNYKKLQQLGEKYDIKMVSGFADIPEFSTIDIYVKPRRKDLSFFKKFFRPTGTSSFKTKYTYLCDRVKSRQDFIKAIDEAILNLGKKITLHK